MNAPAVGSFPTPDAHRIDNGDTIAFGTVNPPTLAQPKIDDRGARIPAQRVYGGTLARADEESAQMLLNVADVLGERDVPEPVLDDIRRSLTRLSGDADAVRAMLRVQRLIDAHRAGDIDATNALIRGRKILDDYQGDKPAVAPDASCPDWCNDCCQPGNGPLHIGSVGKVTESVYGAPPHTTRVELQRSDEVDGTPGKAHVFLMAGETELTPEGALRLADLLTSAARIALHDQAEQAARGGAR